MMVLGAVGYALILVTAVAFFLFYPGYLAFYALLLFLALPLVSLLFALLRRRRCALSVTCPVSLCRRGQSADALLGLTTPAMDPGERARLTLRVEPLLYPQLAYELRRDVQPGQEVPISLELDHCGWYRLSVTKARMPDWLGVMDLPLPTPQAAMVLVWPRSEGVPVPETPEQKAGAPLRPRPGGGPGEEYELRPYRPGDPVNAIHWKLTAKQPTDEPVLRETLEPERERLVISYDHFGPPQELDGVLDRLEALARRLLDKGDAFTVCYAEPTSGALRWHDVDCVAAWERCYHALSGLAAPLVGQGLPPGPLALPGGSGPVKRIHLSPLREQEVTEP